jgi:sugar/nucleoside kinase (ribokinase family)
MAMVRLSPHHESTPPGLSVRRIPGGSAANVTKGVAAIAGPGARCRFLGCVASDATGSEYKSKMAATGVEPLLLVSLLPFQ